MTFKAKATDDEGEMDTTSPPTQDDDLEPNMELPDLIVSPEKVWVYKGNSISRRQQR